MSEKRPGRNDPCHCGSGKKYKHCCMRKDLKARATQRAARSLGPDLPEPMTPFKDAQPEPPIPAMSPASPPPDPYLEAFNARWEEFETSDYEGQIALFDRTLDEEGLMDGEMAFEMLNIIYHNTVDRDERDRFEALVDRLRERRPDLYVHDAHTYLDWRITNALAQGEVEALPALANEMATTAGKGIDTFFNVLDRLAYHGHLPVLLEATRRAWPQVQETDSIVPWGVDEFVLQAGDYVIFDYVERHPAPDASDPELIANLEFYFEVDAERLARYLGHLTGAAARRWTLDDFKLKRRDRPRASFDEEDEEDEENQERDEGRQNLYDLSIEFLGYLRREEHVPYTKGELGREQVLRYILERHAGELEPQESLFEALQRPKRRKRRQRSRQPRQLLCPDRSTLDRFLGGLLHFINPQRYKAAATLELIPAWLRFLDSRRLIDADERAKTMLAVRGLDTELRKVWQDYRADPALERGLDGWGEE